MNWLARQKHAGMTLARQWSGLGKDGGRANIRGGGLCFRVADRYGRVLGTVGLRFFSFSPPKQILGVELAVFWSCSDTILLINESATNVHRLICTISVTEEDRLRAGVTRASA
jgi:hypothetical protein